MPENPIYISINDFCKALELEFDTIPAERKALLLSLGTYIIHKIAVGETPKLIVICTHNSRRSHIGQLWLAISADYFELPQIQTFSGGTEATAFNIRAVNALRRIGLAISMTSEVVDNPIYNIKWTAEMRSYQAFSKKYEAAPNPKEKFAAIMVCSEADVGCPLVSGADFRISLPYDDPKEYDGTDLENEKYDERVRQIGREILFLMHQVKAAVLSKQSN